MLSNYLMVANEQFEIRYEKGEGKFAQEAINILNKALLSTAGYFQILQPFPKVRVVLTTTRDEFDRLVRDLLQVEIEVPSNPARIAQPQRTDMVVLSPSAYESHSIFKYVPDQFGRLLAHELVHMIEEYLSPNIEASPRWWGEGLAVYLSKQWLWDDEYRTPVIIGIGKNEIPSFVQIESETKLAYDWGWTIVKFFDEVFGSDTILKIVKECEDGNVFSMIGDEPDSLEGRWKTWLHTSQYLKESEI